MSKLLEMFQQDFMLNVIAGTTIVAALCSYLGVFIVLRRAVFVGAALAQVSSLGVAVSYALRARIETRYRRPWSRLLIAALAFWQPIARGWARYSTWIRKKRTPRKVVDASTPSSAQVVNTQPTAPARAMYSTPPVATSVAQETERCRGR